jgi:hypothetical protein
MKNFRLLVLLLCPMVGCVSQTPNNPNKYQISPELQAAANAVHTVSPPGTNPIVDITLSTALLISGALATWQTRRHQKAKRALNAATEAKK